MCHLEHQHDKRNNNYDAAKLSVATLEHKRIKK